MSSPLPKIRHSVVSSAPTSRRNTPLQRLSQLYQYYNAPEVLPALGIENNNAHYKQSQFRNDKQQPSPTAIPAPAAAHFPPAPQYSPPVSLFPKELEPIERKAPIIIFGMKLRTFLVVSLVVICVIIGAAVGGALGRPKTTDTATVDSVAATTTAASTTTSATAVTSTYAAATPTYTVLNDCPAANNTLNTLTLGTNSSYAFVQRCGVASPLTAAETLGQSFVYSFADCIETCAALDYYAGNNTTCNVAVFEPAAARPANCFVGEASVTGFAGLASASGTNVAILET